MLYARQTADLKSKNNYSSTRESMLWRIAGPSAHQLQETVLKMTKRDVHNVVVNCIRLRTFWTPSWCLASCFVGILESDGSDLFTARTSIWWAPKLSTSSINFYNTTIRNVWLRERQWNIHTSVSCCVFCHPHNVNIGTVCLIILCWLLLLMFVVWLNKFESTAKLCLITHAVELGMSVDIYILGVQKLTIN